VTALGGNLYHNHKRKTMTTLPESSQETSDTETYSDVFEGPEKKLEVYFSKGADSTGFRRFQKSVWSDVLADAACTILHQESDKDVDAYLLSESSLFVYPERVILKTCGTTTLLLTLPKLLLLAEQIGSVVEHVLYGHLRYKFPEQQVYPHSSFDEEREYLSRTLGNAEAHVLGPADGCCWYVLYASGGQQKMSTPLAGSLPKMEGDDIFEVAMEGLSDDVCAQFFKASHPDVNGKELAERMTVASGIADLLPGVKVDDWAFEPCGYSMNGLRGGFYYTIHITPENGFSYASFETNDPKYREPVWVERIASTFAPSVLTLTLTTRQVGCELDAFRLGDFERGDIGTTQLGKKIAVSSMSFARSVEPQMDVKVGAPTMASRWWA